ncbi:MAG: poly(A) polymerase, partial [Enterobacterales bacterium]
PSARLWAESHKLFLAGYSADTFACLEQYHLLEPILPQMCIALKTNNNPNFRAFLQAALTNTDSRIRSNKSLNPAFLYACFLWQSVRDTLEDYRKDGFQGAEAMQKAQAVVLTEQVKSIAIPKRFTQVIREIWLMQHRLEFRRGKNLLSVIEHPRFRAGYDFLLLRASIGEIKQGTADWWTTIQELDGAAQKKMYAEISPKPRRRKPMKKAGASKPNAD